MDQHERNTHQHDSAEQTAHYEDDGEYVGERYCWACGGRGYVVRCPDDLCHGQDKCIHGDPPTPCWECNKKGDLEDLL